MMGCQQFVQGHLGVLGQVQVLSSRRWVGGTLGSSVTALHLYHMAEP